MNYSKILGRSPKILYCGARWVGGLVNVVGGRRAKVGESSTDIFIPHTKEPNTSVLTSTFLA